MQPHLGPVLLSILCEINRHENWIHLMPIQSPSSLSETLLRKEM